MTEHAPPARQSVRSDGPTTAPSQTGRSRNLRALAIRTDSLLVAIDGLLRRIDAVWNEAPETLAMLADWSDTLQTQRRDILDWNRAIGRRPFLESRLRRMARDVGRDLALLLYLGRRVRQLAVLGERLRAAQADGVVRSDDVIHRAMLDRHHARTERHLARVRERMHPGR